MASIDEEEKDDKDEDEEDIDERNASFTPTGTNKPVVWSAMETQQGAKIAGRGAKKRPEATQKRDGTIFSKWFPV